jgi:nucleoside-diphosphate-sugar epimerase
MTHNTDFARALVPILGSAAAVGEAFHITSDEVLTWNQITEAIADAAGLEPDIVHIASDFVAAVAPEFEEGLLGDKAYSAVFDNSKIKRFVPGFEAAVPLAEGLARSLAWFDADPARKVVNTERDALLDRIIAAYAAA